MKKRREKGGNVIKKQDRGKKREKGKRKGKIYAKLGRIKP
jgi:hypothetical protein